MINIGARLAVLSLVTGFAVLTTAQAQEKKIKRKICLLRLRKLSLRKAKAPKSTAFQPRSIRARHSTK